MSYPFGNGSTMTEQAQTRANQGSRKSKRETGGPQTKRAALGIITNQATRSQPSRAVKQGAFTENFSIYGDENAVCVPAGKSAFSVQPPTQSFQIYVDEGVEYEKYTNIPPAKDTFSSEKLQLLPEVVSLPSCSEQNISVIDLDSSNSDSPMNLDVSMTDRTSSQHVSEQESREDIILTVPEYSEDIYRYLRAAELKHRPKPTYMRKQTDITYNMRAILVDWLVEVAEEYKLHRETLFLAVDYIDRFLSLMQVMRGKLQLVGAASMFLAAKYEEIYPPDVGEFVYITDDTYTKKQVLRMEHLILKTLQFDVAVPTANCFIELFIKKAGCADNVESLAMYLAELSLVDAERYLFFLPSTIAAACVCMASYALHKPAWSQRLYHVTGYQILDFGDCLSHVYHTMRNAHSNPQQAIVEKYKHAKFHNVSMTMVPSCLPDFASFN